MQALSGYRIAFLVDDGFQQLELTECAEALLDADAEIEIVAPLAGRVRAQNLVRPGMKFSVDRTIDGLRIDDFDALVIPGGQASIEKLRRDGRAIEVVRGFVAQGKPIGAIGLGPALLIEARAIEGKRVVANPNLRGELERAGGQIGEDGALFDGPIVTARGLEDVVAFSKMLVELIAGGMWKRPAQQATADRRPRAREQQRRQAM
ncbi:MAG TPA: DJ-1/PfpI family protein [Planctomycetota bacterium]|nr:DJ-1/PfpI family protein [Planctomycetota bacterium]